MCKEKILIMEDNTLNRELFTELLEIEGYAVLQAATGKKGLELARSEKPDMVLLDPGLPDMRGVEVLKRLKQDPKTKNIIVVACPASILDEQRKRIIHAGCNGFIPKPINTREFPKMIARIFQEKGEVDCEIETKRC